MKFIYIFLFISFTNLFANNLVEIVLPNDKWKLVGVSGAFMEGSGITNITTNGTWHWGKEYDVNVSTDSNWTGLKLGGNTAEYNSTEYSNYLAGFSVLDSTYQLAILSFDGDGFSIDLTLPRRQIYIDTNGSGTADTNISYQSDLEGETFNMKITTKELITNNYYGVFNSSYGEKNPMTLSKLTGVSSTYYYNIRDIIDMDLTNNPGKDGKSGDISDYVKGNNRDGLEANDYIQVFRLDSKNSVWETFHSEIADSSNDFTALTSGGGYWIKLHDNTEATTKHGLILGDGNISLNTFSINHSELSSANNSSKFSKHSLLANGWNMLSFPDGEIRNGGTGLILTNSGASDGDEFNISDDVGKEKLAIKIFDIDGDGTVSIQELAKSINNSIASAKESDSISHNFNIRAFSSDSANIILFSSQRFRVYDINSTGLTDNVFAGVTTLGGEKPYNLATNTYIATTVETTGIASKYGEYILIATVNNNGAGATAGSIHSGNQGIGSVQINSNTAISIVDNSISAIDNKLSADSDITNDLDLDLDLNSHSDSIMLVNKSSAFYIRDHTFTKVFRLDGTPSAGGNIYGDKKGDSTFTTISLGGDVATSVTNLDSALTITDLESKDDGNYIYITTVNSEYRNFDIKESGIDDNLTRVISNNPLALGSITKVYSISDLAKSDVSKSIFEFDFNASTTNANDDLNISIDGENIDCVVSGNDNAGDICTNCVLVINSTASANVLAMCNTTTLTDTDAKITLTGYFSKATFDVNNSGAEIDLNVSNVGSIKDHNSSAFWDKNSTGGVALQNTKTLTDNLQYNPIHSPSFPTKNNILNNIRENGYKAQAILTAVNNSSGDISWKYTDLTVDSGLWFNEMFDYSLFSTEMEKGYFVRLEEKATTTMNFTSTLLTSSYQHYNSDNGNVSLSQSGNVDNYFNHTLSASVLNGDGNIQVIATIQNRDYKMLRAGNRFSLDLSRSNFPEIAMSDSNITLTAYDETGNIESKQMELNLSSPAKPVVQFFNGKYMFVGSTSFDIKAFNIYSGKIDDRYPIPNNKDNSTYLKNLNPTNDYKTVTAGSPKEWYGNANNEIGVTDFSINSVDYGAGTTNVTLNYLATGVGNVTKTSVETYYFMNYNLCEDSPNFDTNNSGWLITAVDGSGDASNSMVSNITFLSDWFSIYKNASILEVNASGAIDNLPRLYGTNCAVSSTSNNSQDNGVILYDANVTFGDKITISYDTISASPVGTNIPYNTYLCKDGSLKETDYFAKIQFSKNVYVSSLNSALTSPKAILIYYQHGTTEKIYKTDFDKLYSTTEGDCYHLTSSMEIGASGQTIVKGE